LTAAFPFLSVTFVGFLISMFALHLTQYACGIAIQLSVHWSVVVFETHAEPGDTHEGRQRKKREYVFFLLEAPGRVLIQHFYPLPGREHPLELEISSIVSTTLQRIYEWPFPLVESSQSIESNTLLVPPHESVVGLSLKFLR